ncbi:MAG: hypothetical protein Q8R74_09310 [Methylophilus sp.]|nr:hypothetical protein [Methylophilus sp.]
MKMKQIALLIAGLTTSAAAFAVPVTADEISNARQAGSLQQAWLSGASAPTRTVYEGWVGPGNGVGCDIGTSTIFSTQGGTANVPGSLGNFTAYACKRNGIVSVLYHTLDGGSLNAYAPHTVGTRLARVKFVGTGNGCTSSVAYSDPTNNKNNATVWKGCALIGEALPPAGTNAAVNGRNATAVATDPFAPQLPVGGFSDVEAALFPSSIGGGDVSSRGAESDANVGQVFGVAASIPLYRAMQAAQGISESGSSFDPALAPNISRSQYVAIAAAGGAANGDWTPILGAPSTQRVVVERRISTSGTQSSSNAYFLENPCANGAGASLPPSRAIDSNPDYTVNERSGSGNVKTALTDASNAAANTRNQFAIGVLSLENNWRLDSAASAGYRYLKVDGVHPETGDTENARVTATNGNYTFHMELKSFVRSNYAGAPAKTAFENAVVGQITQVLANPEAASCSVFPRGLTLNPLSGSACTLGVQVARMTNLGNNCSPAQFIQ